jgi:ABC-2 type transport system permease protein
MVNGKAYHRNRALLHLVLVLAGIIVFNILTSMVFVRWDLTKEKRYTLTPATKQLLKDLDSPVTVEVFLDGKELPAGIRSLQKATREILQDLRSVSNGKLNFVFVDINKIRDASKKENLQKNLAQLGLFPTNLQVSAEQGYREQLIYPGLVMRKDAVEIAVTILENQMSFGAQGSLDNSISLLEYKLAAALQKLHMKRPPLVVFSQGHGELKPVQLSDLVQTLGTQQYRMAVADLRESILPPDEVDVLVIAKPSRPFAEAEKFKIDQYVMHGGKVLWLLDGAIASLDSFGSSPSIFSVDMPLNLTDLLFRFGVRVNADLVQDLYCNPIPIMEDHGGGAKPILFPWVFHPILRSDNDHPIVRNLDPVAGKFASSIDTIRSAGIEKTILLSTSEYSRTVKMPFEIFLQGAKEKPEPSLFNKQDIPVAVLLEGKFPSGFSALMDDNYRGILSDAGLSFKSASDDNRMIVISDGDIAANELDASGNPLPLGYYKYTRETFANRDFLLNSIEYLLDNSGLLEARNRETRMRLLDKTKVGDQKTLWQIILLGGPLIVLGIFAVVYNGRRKRKYAA